MARSFSELLITHDELTELLLNHQEALLDRDIAEAARRLDAFETLLRPHMRYEDQVLLPVYKRAGRVPGGPEELFTGEHRKLLEFIARIRELLNLAAAAPAGRARNHAVAAIFDEEASFKNLLSHHDARERNILYPKLDEVTSEAEKTQLLGLLN